MRPIDADALINEIKKETEKAIEQDDKVGSFWLGYIAGLAIKQPTIQPQSTVGQINDNARSTAQSTNLIDRQAAIDAIEKMNIPEDMCVFEILSHIEVEIATLPTIQPEPHEGHWINGKCDLCGEHAPFWCLATTYHESNYCPNCGAKMKGVRQK